MRLMHVGNCMGAPDRFEDMFDVFYNIKNYDDVLKIKSGDGVMLGG